MAHIFRIGNLLGFKENRNLVFNVREDGLMISPEKQAREGWERKFKSSKKRRKKPSLLGEFPNEFDEDEWKW